MPAAPLKAGGGPQAKAEIRDIGPVAVVMATEISRPRVVADLIARVTVLFRELLRNFVDLLLHILVRKLQLSPSVQLIKGRALLHDQVIEREVLGL